MYGNQEKILGQKVNVKFFTVDPYVGGAGLPRPFSKFANYWKNIFLKIKTSKIKSEKNIWALVKEDTASIREQAAHAELDS